MHQVIFIGFSWASVSVSKREDDGFRSFIYNIIHVRVASHSIRDFTLYSRRVHQSFCDDHLTRALITIIFLVLLYESVNPQSSEYTRM